jgi:hypothetical protein
MIFLIKLELVAFAMCTLQVFAMEIISEKTMSAGEAAAMLKAFLQQIHAADHRLPPTTLQQLQALQASLKKSAKSAKSR